MGGVKEVKEVKGVKDDGSCILNTASKMYCPLTSLTSLTPLTSLTSLTPLTSNYSEENLLAANDVDAFLHLLDALTGEIEDNVLRVLKVVKVFN